MSTRERRNRERTERMHVLMTREVEYRLVGGAEDDVEEVRE